MNMTATKHKRKDEWINNMTRELEGLKESQEVVIHIDLNEND